MNEMSVLTITDITVWDFPVYNETMAYIQVKLLATLYFFLLQIFCHKNRAQLLYFTDLHVELK